MKLKERKSQGEMKIFLFAVSGELLWTDTEKTDDESVLLSAFIASLFNFSKEFLSEDLYTLQINELDIKIHTILDKFILAIFYNKSEINYELANEMTEDLINEVNVLIKNLIGVDLKTNEVPFFNIDEDELLNHLIILLEDYVNKINQNKTKIIEENMNLIYSFSNLIELFQEKKISVTLFQSINKQVNEIFNYFDEEQKEVKKTLPQFFRIYWQTPLLFKGNKLKNHFIFTNNVLAIIKNYDNYFLIISKSIFSENEFQNLVVFETIEELSSIYDEYIYPILVKSIEK